MRVFVLSGGGAKGSFEVGVLKQLADKDIIPDSIFGTSTGALNAAGYSFIGIDNLLKVWREIKSTSDIMVQRPWFLLPICLLLMNGKGVYSMKPLEKLLDKILLPSILHIEAVVCRVSLITSAKDYVSTADLETIEDLKAFRRAVLASASTPIMNDIVDGEWVDGGVRQITPLQKAIDSGADDITVILAEPYSPSVFFPNKVGNVLDVFNRTIACMVQEMFWMDIHNFQDKNPGLKLTVYAPNISLIEADNFDPAKIEASIQQGLKASPVLTI